MGKESKYKNLYIPPIPLWWFIRASSLPGSSLAVGCLIWFLLKTSQTQSPLKFSRRRYMFVKCSRYSVRRGLASLEKAGLIEVERNQGKAPLITVVTDEESCAGG